MKRWKHALAVAVAAAVLSAGLPGTESAPDAGVCIRPAWGNWSICL